MSNIDLSFQELEDGTITWSASKKELRAYLKVAWELQKKESMYQDSQKAHSAPHIIREGLNAPYAPKQTWLFGCSSVFEKSVQKFDSKFRGRVLTCIFKILRAPMTPIGDTLKPLEGDKKGLWRYREGDYRIVYLPDKTNLRITFVDVDSRCNIYK